MIDSFRHSPHQDERPEGCDITLLVIHNISLPPHSFSGPWIDDLFMARLDAEAHPYFQQLIGLKVSSHLLIRRCGKVIQYVPFDKRAWHAGESSWKGVNNCNDFSIGIELEGTDEEAYTSSQYERLAKVIKSLFSLYPSLHKSSLCGHSEIAVGRKTDPGPAFDWQQLEALIYKNA